MIRTAFALTFIAALSASAEETAVFTVQTMTAQMKYDTAEMLVAPAQPVKIVFVNGDDLPHNLVFCQPGTDTAAMALKQMEKPDEALKRNWLPDDPRIWAHSKMLNPHEKQEITFTAPEKPGSYPYVCTFPGHAMTMRGELKVAPAAEGLKNLQFALYLGNWKNLPDFSTLTPHRSGQVEDNRIAVKLDDYKNEFGVVFTGKLNVPKKGAHRFYLASDDGARILIDGKRVVESDGIHPASTIQEGSVNLEAGEHTFRLEYFQAAGNIELYAAYKSATSQITPLSTWLHPNWKGGVKKQREFDPIPLVVKDEPVIYRNFIEGAGNRGIGVGYPGGVNMAWSAESMNLAVVWRGAFIDASRHWNSRGGGHQPPLGYGVCRPTGEVTPALHISSDPASAWPVWDKVKRYEGFQWKGYSLDAKRSPTFRYTWGEVEVTETYAGQGDGNKVDGVPVLLRTVEIRGKVPANAWYRLASGKVIAQGEAFIVEQGGTRLRLTCAGARLAGSNLVVAAQAGTLSIRYEWVP